MPAIPDGEVMGVGGGPGADVPRGRDVPGRTALDGQDAVPPRGRCRRGPDEVLGPVDVARSKAPPAGTGPFVFLSSRAV